VGWNIEGTYHTVTSALGESTLFMRGTLQSPQELDALKSHYSIICFGHENQGPTDYLWIGWSPLDRDNFFYLSYSADQNIEEAHLWS
jgi:hypothetical protein